jgi:murein DD-endopeptidase MepM/ murein hydrolase activator NlpD
LLCLLFLSSCGDFSSIFEKGQARRTGKHKAPSAHDKGKQTVATKTRNRKGRILTGMFIWPIDGEISSPFGERGGHPHDGIDIRAEKGTRIHAAADGEVVFSGSLGGYGNLVLLKHRSGYFTAYAHTEENLVKEGKQVEQGDGSPRWETPVMQQAITFTSRFDMNRPPWIPLHFCLPVRPPPW